MEIIYRENVMPVFELREAKSNIHWIIKHFLYNYDEVLYFVEDGFLRAVVSVGDIFKYVEGKEGNILNINFTQVSEENLNDAEVFFLEHPTIHELPLIDSTGHFMGIVKSGGRNSEHLQIKFQRRIKAFYFDLPSYYQKLSEKFMKHFKGQVFLVDLPCDNKVLERLPGSHEREVFAKKNAVPPLEQLQRMGEQEEKNYWGARERGISQKFVKEFKEIKVLEKSGCKYYENSELSHYITFDKGKRAVINKAEAAEKKIYMVGPCTIFGAYVTDDQTVEYYLQELLNQNEYSFQVVNFGSLGLYYEFQYLLTECISDDDIVIIASQNRKLISIMSQYENTCYLGDYSDIFDGIDNPMTCILDTFRHVNYKGSKEFAKRIYSSISASLMSENGKSKSRAGIPIQDYFIPWDIVTYYKEFALNYDLNNLDGIVGAIVMNCNPFTKGHRYLIEYAAERVDTLVVFVVEENASMFSFTDRMEMVKLGTADIPNVRVVPSGKYNISKSTFAQYFEKEKVIDRIDSMDYDLRIFCEVIADCMHISCRFAGEEPTDIVTRQYNETMKRILPQYGIEFIEIPRLKTRGEEYISASKARKYLKDKDWEDVSNFLPATTADYLKKHVSVL